MFLNVQSFTVMSSIDTSGTTDGGCVWIGWDSGGNSSWCCDRVNDCWGVGGNSSWCCDRVNDCWGGGGNSSWCCDRVNNCWDGVFMYFTWMDSNSLTTFKTTNIITFSIRPLGETVKAFGVFLIHTTHAIQTTHTHLAYQHNTHSHHAYQQNTHTHHTQLIYINTYTIGR